MASLFAPVEDGKIVETMSQTSLKKANSANNGMDKEAFLQLLVAQMQYQDPLQPTTNTEYVAQYAQFSQVEQIQNMAASTDLARASALVGETVFVKVTSSSGAPGVKEGKVDYVVFENNKAYLSIEESLYSIDDLDTIVDLEYKQAFDKAYSFTLSLNMLPRVSAIDLSYKDKIEKLKEIYEGMNDYEKSFLAEDTVKRYKEYVERLKLVQDAADKLEQEGNGSTGGGTEGMCCAVLCCAVFGMLQTAARREAAPQAEQRAEAQREAEQRAAELRAEARREAVPQAAELPGRRALETPDRSE